MKNKGKEKIEITTITGKITIYRTILSIVGDIDLKKYKLKSKNIIPLDEYLGIDKLPFKVSIRAMVEIAFWGQNQPSFQRASEIIKRVHNIEISHNNIRKITEYVGKIVYDYNYSKAEKIWKNRAKLNIDNNKSKGILYIEADGAAVMKIKMAQLGKKTS